MAQLARITQYLFIMLIIVSCSSKTIKNGFKNDESAANRPYVLLISFDGFRHDYINRFNPPNLKKFISGGVKAKSLRPIYPSSTFPNHYSIVTGMYAGNHGIISNSFYDEENNRFYKLSDRAAVRDGSFYGGEPLWNTVQKNGMASATFYWPGSEADIGGMYPSYWLKYVHTTPHKERIDQIIDWFELPIEKRPHFVTLYFPDTDDYGHKYGTTSVEIKNKVMDLDKTFGKLMNELDKLPFKVNVIVVSDHGMQNYDPKKIEYIDDCISIKGIKIPYTGPYANLYIEDKTKVKGLVKKLNRCKKSFKAYRRNKTPKKFHLNEHKHLGDILVTAKELHLVAIRNGKKFSKGIHGYNPYRYKSMHGIFLASGPNIKSGIEIGTFDNIHIYPFILELLGAKYTHKIDGNLDILKWIIRK